MSNPKRKRKRSNSDSNKKIGCEPSKKKMKISKVETIKDNSLYYGLFEKQLKPYLTPREMTILHGKFVSSMEKLEKPVRAVFKSFLNIIGSNAFDIIATDKINSQEEKVIDKRIKDEFMSKMEKFEVTKKNNN